MFPVTIYTAPYGDECRHSRDLLVRAAQRISGRETGEILCTPLGKPYFPALPEFHFSVTHSGEWWMCAASHRPVGLDLQIHRTYLPPQSLSERFFHPLEDRYLSRHDYIPFFDLWAAKESYTKYTGRGLSDGTESFSVVSVDGTFPAAEDCEIRVLPFREGYSLCVASQFIGEVRIITL